MSRTTLSLLLAALLFSTGCEDQFDIAQKTHTIEGYDKYLAENPNGQRVLEASLALEDLYLEKARSDESLDGYDAYVKRFPKGKHMTKIMDERKQFLFDWAAEEDTPAAWNRFLDEYKTGAKKLRTKARQRLRMAENRDKVSSSPPEVEQVNLAENPDGPLDGWGFTADFTNEGTEAIKYLMVEIQYLDSAGKAVQKDQWPAVSERLPGNLPMEEGFSEPIQPNTSRTFHFTTGDLPADWSKKVKLVPVDIGFAK
jgi:hypothetical protein